MAANHTSSFVLPFDVQLVHVSACNSSANAGKIDIGIPTDTDAYLDGEDVGVSGVPAEFDRDDFVGDQYPHIAAGTVTIVTITDHASHMANVYAVLTFTEG